MYRDEREIVLQRKAEGRRQLCSRHSISSPLKKMRVVGLKPTKKKMFFERRVGEEKRRPCFNPTLLSVGTSALRRAYFCLVNITRLPHFFPVSVYECPTNPFKYSLSSSKETSVEINPI